MTSSRAFAPLDFMQLLLIALIWGVNNVAAKVALEDMPPLFAVSMRFLLVFLVLGWRIRPVPLEKAWLFVAMLACVGPIHFGVQYIGLSLARDLAPMIVAMQLWAPASVLFAMLLLKERAGGLRVAGVATAFLGTAALAFDPIVFAQGGALFMVACAACSYGLGTVLVRLMGPSVDAWAMQAWLALASAPVLLFGSVLFEGDPVRNATEASWLSWACVGFGALLSGVLANALMFRLVQRYEVSRTTPYLLSTPVISFALAAFVLGDVITWRLILGAALTMSGVLLVALAERRFKAMA
ncbi:permease [alpha proteobacterium U9-1i]|nr:permease [alpha proteobacterium U9-1i]